MGGSFDTEPEAPGGKDLFKYLDNRVLIPFYENLALAISGSANPGSSHSRVLRIICILDGEGTCTRWPSYLVNTAGSY